MIPRRLTVLLAAFQLAASATAESIADRWNLADIYASTVAWHADAAKLDAQMTEFAACKGHLGDTAARFRKCLDAKWDMTKRYYRLSAYSAEQLAADTGSPAFLELDQKSDVLGGRLREATAFVDPEILRIGRDRIAAFLKDDPALAIYRFPLDRVLRAAPHTLGDDGEAIVAGFGPMDNAGASTYAVLVNADMPWPTLTLTSGEAIRLDGAAFAKHRESANRDDRKHVMEAFFGAFKPYERTLGMTLYAQLKQDAVYSKVRRYDNSLARALDRDRVPVAVFDTLIAEAHAGLPTLHRYFRLRAKMLGLAQLQYYDVHAPLAQGDFVFPLARGRVLLLEAVAPLGKEYVDALSKGLDSRWMDAYPRPRKQSGAHMSDNAFDVHPYLLMNYTGNYESVTTLAHEWGHAMHSVLAAGAQPYVTGNYTVFVAEIASSLNEGLLLDRVLKSAKSDDERLFYLASALEGLRGMFFMQAMSAEFERDIHAVVDGGEPLTGEALSKAFCENLKRYLGTGEGIVGVDDRYCIGWAAIEQLYSPFYVYQYATSLAASAQFGKQIVAGEPGAQKRYLDLLRAGGSDDPYVLVKRAGVDLATPAPYRALVAQMNGYLDEIEAILARRR